MLSSDAKKLTGAEKPAAQNKGKKKAPRKTVSVKEIASHIAISVTSMRVYSTEKEFEVETKRLSIAYESLILWGKLIGEDGIEQINKLQNMPAEKLAFARSMEANPKADPADVASLMAEAFKQSECFMPPLCKGVRVGFNPARMISSGTSKLFTRKSMREHPLRQQALMKVL